MSALAEKPAETGLISGVPDAAVPFVLARMLREQGRTMLHIATSDRQMVAIRDALAFFAPAAEILTFPAWDCLPYDRASPGHALMSERLATLGRLASCKDFSKPLIVLTTVNAVLQRVLPHAVVGESVFTIAPGDTLDRERLTQYLVANGYRRSESCMEAGEFALRGSLIDLIPAGESMGVRVDLFGDEVESLRHFDPMTQRSAEKVDSLQLLPASEAKLDERAVQRFRNNYREAFGAVTRDDPLYEAVSEAIPYPGMEHWLPLFYERMETLFDYLPKDTAITLAHREEEARADRLESIADYYSARQQMDAAAKSRGGLAMESPAYHPLPPIKLYLVEGSMKAQLARFEHFRFTPFRQDKAGPLSYDAAAVPAFFRSSPSGPQLVDALRDYQRQARGQKRKLIVAAFSEGSAERMKRLLSQHELPVQPIHSLAETEALADGNAGIAVLPLDQGFAIDGLAFVSEQDLFGERIHRSQRKKRKASEVFMAEAASLELGELIVHREHGIGRFEGLETLEVQGQKHDFLKLVYADEDKLFLPVENIDLISRYGQQDEENPTPLDKLGGASWQARKARARERIKLAAEALMKVAAERALAAAPALTPPQGAYAEFCTRFPYSETDDQERAIEEVLEDLASGHPSDRLICGDVGFGKTEVALRAAFAAAMAEEGPMQVAIITPTTLLARQHYQNFKKRFEGFPVEVRMLSRLTSAKDAKETKEGIKSGKVRLVIGTHALLGKGIEFQNLGLLIVDEEQHFGVKQKEQLKALRSDIHVLTLSATPIPRTLQLALAGVRELSLITTPPVDRLAVRSFVMPFDGIVIREAIQRELHRGGQVFYVTPRIKDLAELQVRLRDLVPEARFAVAHGQMPPSQLDSIVGDFYDGKYDILLSTSIIESGLDIPNANTIIINRAGLFGLSQLYQMRGRVGRAKRRAYAYFTLPHGRNVTNMAVKRLEIMQTLDSLGAGFSVASHDMDLRGFGNLVGEEQSGQIREVGVELYQQMLEDAVNAAKRDKKADAAAEAAASAEDEWSPQLNLGQTVLIPEDYVPELGLRLSLYRRAGALKTGDDIAGFAAELTDRFGQMPDEVRQFLEVLEIKQQAKQACIERIDAGPKGLVVSFYKQRVDAQALLAMVARAPRRYKLRPDEKLVIFTDGEKAPTLAFVREQLEALSKVTGSEA